MEKLSVSMVNKTQISEVHYSLILSCKFIDNSVRVNWYILVTG